MMITAEQAQDYFGPDIDNIPLRPGDFDDVQFCLIRDRVSPRTLALQLWKTDIPAPSLGPFGRLRALMALQMGNPVGPMAFIEPYYKLITFVPPSHLKRVRESLWEAGAGQIGRYSRCSYVSSGTGTFWPEDGTQPFLGQIGNLNQESERRLEVVVPKWYQRRVEQALLRAHPYEEVAFDWIALRNRLEIASAYCDSQGEWWFIEDNADLMQALLDHRPAKVHCEKLTWSSRLILAEAKIPVDMKQPGELLYPGLHKLWGDKKKPWE